MSREDLTRNGKDLVCGDRLPRTAWYSLSHGPRAKQSANADRGQWWTLAWMAGVARLEPRADRVEAAL